MSRRRNEEFVLGNSPTLAEWNELYEAAIAFRDMSPWTWMDGEHLFAVQPEEGGPIAYCSVMGELGELHGLAVYPGREGWESMNKIRDVMPGDSSAMYEQKALIATFEGSKDVDKRDRAVIQQLGLRF